MPKGIICATWSILSNCDAETTGSQSTYHNLHSGVAITHLLDQSRERSNDVGRGLALLDDIVGTQMHRDNISRVLLQPAHKLLLVRNVDGKESRVALIVPIILGVFAAIFIPSGSDKVHRGPLCGLQFVPQLGPPAGDLSD